MFCGLGEEERTKIRKKNKEKKRKKRKKKEKKEKKGKKKKKEINLIAAKSGLVGMKGYLETYNSMKYFLPYLSRCSDSALYRTTVICVLLKSPFQCATIVFKTRTER